jgi:carbamoyl-phosphate synthase small subunit
MAKIGQLVLEDGTVLKGRLFGATRPTAGEVVFNTGMVGYPETLTDPSYRGQILTLTYPLIGNYGVPLPGCDQFGLPDRFESARIQASGLIISELCLSPSNGRSAITLEEWLQREGIPGLAGIDTRALTKHLRSHGTLLGRIMTDDTDSEPPYPDPTEFVPSVSVQSIEHLEGLTDISAPGERPRIVLVDCGCKANIIRSVLKRGCDVVRVPYDHDFSEMEYDGLLLGNGPGDPSILHRTIANVGKAIRQHRPILGICLGHQLLALAAGARSYKLKFGHRSQNQPCLQSGPDDQIASASPARCMVTSQNHGYAIAADTIPDGWAVWFTNANDGTVEGIRHLEKPFYGVQFHPEATPGPVDSAWIFDDFVARLREAVRANSGAAAATISSSETYDQNN